MSRFNFLVFTKLGSLYLYDHCSNFLMFGHPCSGTSDLLDQECHFQKSLPYIMNIILHSSNSKIIMWKRTTILKGIFDYRSVFITYGKEIESKGLRSPVSWTRCA